MTNQDNSLRFGSGNLAFILCFAAVVVAGILVGYTWEGAKPSSSVKNDPAVEVSGQEVNGQENVGQANDDRRQLAGLQVHRFPLNEADINDGIEAPTFAILDSGRMALAWATTVSATARQVMMVTSEDNGRTFSSATPVVTTGIHTSISKMRGRTVERKTRTLPHLAAHGETLFLAWVDAAEDRASVVMKLSESVDATLAFSDPIPVHQSTAARPTFTSMSIGDDGTIACSWLDNRNKVQQPFASVRRPDKTQFEPEKMVYAGPDERGICPCCPTAAFVSNGDVLVTFRANEGGFRDMWTATWPSNASGFQAPVPHVKPTWKFDGCPHDGPAICKTSHGLHVAWMDAHTGTEQVYVGTNGSVAQPTSISHAATRGKISMESQSVSAGHPQLAAYQDVLYLAWDQSLPSGRAIFLAKSIDGGETFSSAIALAPTAGHFQTRPRIRISKDGRIVVAWMELSRAGKSVVVATVPNETLK